MANWIPISGIYCVRNLDNGKVYIGASTSINRRKAKHRNLLRSGKHRNSYMQEDFSVSLASFEHSILELCPKEKFVERESYWILFYDALNPDKGYNSVLPSDNKICRPGVYEKKSKGKVYVCINKLTGEVIEQTAKEIQTRFNIKKFYRICSYWAGNKKGNQASTGGWVFVRLENYDPTFDYVNYDGVKEYRKNYVPKPKVKKEPKVRTYENCKRTPILLQSMETGKDLQFRGLADAIKELRLVYSKVMKCLNAPFGKYSHHGYWMKRI